MEYEYFLWLYEETLYHLIRVEPAFTTVAQGRIFQGVIRRENGDGEIFVLTRDSNGVHVINVVMPMLLSEKYLDDLAWERRVWGEDTKEEE